MSRNHIIMGVVVVLVGVAIIAFTTWMPQTKPQETLMPPPATDVVLAPATLRENVVVQKPTHVESTPVVIAHPVLGRFVTKNAANRLPSDFPEQVPTISNADEIAAVLIVLHDHTDLDSIRNEAINLVRRSHLPDVDKHLLNILDAPEESDRFRSFVVQHLGDMMIEFINSADVGATARSGYIRDRLVKALTDRDLSVKREALLALTNIRNPQVTAIIRTGLSDPTWVDAHDVLIRCAYDANLSDLIPQIRPLAYDERTPVRIAAIVALSGWKDAASKPAFEEAQRSSVVRIHRAGTLAMQVLESP